MKRILLPLVCLSLVGCERATPQTPAAETPKVVIADDGKALPDATAMEKLITEDPVAFLENCLRRYKREVKGYTCIFEKRERIGGLHGKLHDKEIIDVVFRENPFGVLFRWIEGARKAERALYVEGENNGKMLARPSGFANKLAPIVERDVDGEDARQSGRYTLKDFGMYHGCARTLATWRAARADNALKVDYLGEKKVKEVGDRLCYVLRRVDFKKPEEEGVRELTIYIDKDNWLQVGSLLKGEDGKFIAEYYFRDIRLNPELKPEQLSRAALVPK